MNIEDKVNDLSYMTGAINMMARNDDLDLCYTKHCVERMQERGITVSDILFVLKTGILQEYQGRARHPSSDKMHKYLIVGEFLGGNKSNREIGLVILVEINQFGQPAVKIQEIVTTMWRD